MSLFDARENPALQKMPANQQEWIHYMNEFAKHIAAADDFLQSQIDVVVAQATADAAQVDADAAQSTANTGVSDAATAQTTANTGVTNAAAAQSDADDAQTDATTGINDAASAQGTADTAATDLVVNNVSVEDLSQKKWTHNGTWPADDSDDHVLSFKRQGVEIATHTIRAVFTQSSGVWTVTSQAESGEATVETITGSGGADAKAVVSHTGSGVIGKVSLVAEDQSAAGGSPSK